MIRPFLLAAALAPSLASALPWDGTYRLGEDADCDRVGEEGGSLRIEEGVLQGVESTCRMTDAVDVLNLDATLYVMECEGEGQSWTERAMLMKAAEGDAIFLAWRGYVFRYDRCPEPEGASEEAEDSEETPASEEAESSDAGEGQGAEGGDGADAPAEEPSEEE
jgi:hypothetical protein